MRGARGFSLVEVLVATGVLATGLLTLAQLLAMAYAANVAARQATSAMALAVQKIEEIRANPVAAALGSIEYADERGALVGTGGGAPARAVYVRRWSAEARAVGSSALLLVQVRVDPISGPSRAERESARLTAAIPVSVP